MRKQIKRLAILALGWMFLILGVAGLFLPILQGVLFILVGLLILAEEYHWARRWLHRLRERFPTIARHADHFRDRWHAWWRRITKRGATEPGR